MYEKLSQDNWFSSEYYHQLHAEHREAEPFIQKLIERLGISSGSRALDTACARGLSSKLLANTGFEVTGLDYYTANIEHAQRNIPQQNGFPEFFQHDIRLPFRGNYYNVAFNLFTKFGQYRTRREHDDAMRTVANALKPGGLFIIDYANVHYQEDHLHHNETKQIGNTGYEMHRWDDELYFYKQITITSPSLPEPATIVEKRMKLSLGDFTDMLSFQRMQVQEVLGNYDFDEYDIRKTPRLIIIAQKTS